MNYELTQVFRFKQFTIDDSACAMKVGTDGVLLGAWANVSNANSALDIGTGSGLIAVMLAQRNPLLTVVGVDIDSCAVSQAQANAEASPYSSRLRFLNCDILDMDTSSSYDLIVSNPPFYQEQTSCPDSRRDSARHTSSLPFDALARKVKELLSPAGIFCVIIPTDAAANFISTCASHCLYLCQRTDVHTSMRKTAKRTLLSFTNSHNAQTVTHALFMRDETNNYSQEYLALVKEFYLNM